MNIFPTCKINLGLHVLEKRDDGFHNLDTVMVEVPFTDAITFSESTHDQLDLDGIPVQGDDNLVTKALQLARDVANIPPLKIRLTKNIPMGAGLGGGSSNAAQFYRALAQSYFPERTATQLEIDIASIGSDCAFFIRGGVQHCTGRGEILHPIQLDLFGLSLLIINPGIHISTKEAFSGVTPSNHRASVANIVLGDKKEWNKTLINDFEASAFQLYPELEKIKQSLYEKGAFYASMSGSGSTMFGLFESTTELNSFGSNYFEKLIQF